VERLSWGHILAYRLHGGVRHIDTSFDLLYMYGNKIEIFILPHLEIFREVLMTAVVSEETRRLLFGMVRLSTMVQ
jgi:hypothetical protein